MTNKQKPELTVYFNSACPVCKAGITAQKGKSTECQINWNDVHANNKLVDEIDKDLPTVRKYLHLTTKEGELKVGIDAFIELWKNSPNEKWIAKVVSLPVIKQLTDIAYILFANFLYKWNKAKKHW